MNDNKLQVRNSTAEFLIFSAQSGANSIEVRFERETIWLTQKLMATLFDCSTDNISLHLKNIFTEGELQGNSVAEDFSATAADGKDRLFESDFDKAIKRIASPAESRPSKGGRK